MRYFVDFIVIVINFMLSSPLNVLWKLNLTNAFNTGHLCPLQNVAIIFKVVILNILNKYNPFLLSSIFYQYYILYVHYIQFRKNVLHYINDFCSVQK